MDRLSLTRRGLLGLLGAAALDPERLLWVPGSKLISVPRRVGPWTFGPMVGDTILVRRPIRFIPYDHSRSCWISDETAHLIDAVILG